jgi:hypothetical protein
LMRSKALSCQAHHGTLIKGPSEAPAPKRQRALYASSTSVGSAGSPLGVRVPEVVSPARERASTDSLRARHARLIAQAGVYAYIMGFAASMNVNALLLLLAGCSIAAAWLSAGEEVRLTRSPIVYFVVLFLTVAGLTIVHSENVSRSFRLSAPMVPAVLLFFLIHQYFRYANDLRNLYVCLTLVALGLATALLWPVVTSHDWNRGLWLAAVGSPILLVPNDLTLLAVIGPLTLASIRSLVA